MHEPIVYWRPGCPFCMKLRAKLRATRTPHRLVDIWQDPAAAAQVRAANDGNELVPTVQVGDVWLSNPSLGQVRRAVQRT